MIGPSLAAGSLTIGPAGGNSTPSFDFSTSTNSQYLPTLAF